MKLNITLLVLPPLIALCLGVFIGTVWPVYLVQIELESESYYDDWQPDLLVTEELPMYDNIYIHADSGIKGIYVDDELIWPKTPITITEITITPEPEIITETITVYQELKDFESLVELKQFVNDWKSSNWLMATTTDHQCEFYAMKLQADAQEAGYLINCQISGNHMHNSVIIGNDIYFIEPQTGIIEFWGTLE